MVDKVLVLTFVASCAVAGYMVADKMGAFHQPVNHEDEIRDIKNSYPAIILDTDAVSFAHGLRAEIELALPDVSMAAKVAISQILTYQDFTVEPDHIVKRTYTVPDINGLSDPLSDDNLARLYEIVAAKSGGFGVTVDSIIKMGQTQEENSVTMFANASVHALADVEKLRGSIDEQKASQLGILSLIGFTGPKLSVSKGKLTLTGVLTSSYSMPIRELNMIFRPLEDSEWKEAHVNMALERQVFPADILSIEDRTDLTLSETLEPGAKPLKDLSAVGINIEIVSAKLADGSLVTISNYLKAEAVLDEVEHLISGEVARFEAKLADNRQKFEEAHAGL